MVDVHVTDENIEIEKIQKLMEELKDAKGNGNSLVSINVPCDDALSRVSSMLEFASEIESSVKREPAIRAIKAAQQKLQLYSKVPANGLLMYTGIVVTDAGNKKEVSIDFEPFERVRIPLFSLENKFRIEALSQLLEYEDNYIRENDNSIAIWKLQRLIKTLKYAKGKDTCLISLIMEPEDEISEFSKRLDDMFGTASSTESAIKAIRSAQQKLQLYGEVPPNGLVIYSGTIVTNDGIEKEVTVDFEPFRLIRDSFCVLDRCFRTQALTELLRPELKYGFIVMADNKILFGMLSGNKREVLENSRFDPPSEYNFPRHIFHQNYLRRVVDRATVWYINNHVDIFALVVAVSPIYKEDLTARLDHRLQEKIMCSVEVSYGGDHGFNDAIALSSLYLDDVRFVQEKSLLRKFMKELAEETGKSVYGLEATLNCLQSRVVKNLIVWENLEVNRYVLKNTMTEEIVTKHLNQEEETDESNFRDSGTNAKMEVQERTSLLDWFAQGYKKFGCTTLEFVTNSSSEGSQFCRGFCGIGGILRYPLKISSNDDLSDDGENYA